MSNKDINKNKIFIIKNLNKIIICHDGKKLVIDKNNSLFDELSKLDKEQIRDWYINR